LVAKCGVYMSNEYKAMMLAVMTANWDVNNILLYYYIIISLV
jgi:hypothetical protein